MRWRLIMVASFGTCGDSKKARHPVKRPVCLTLVTLDGATG